MICALLTAWTVTAISGWAWMARFASTPGTQGSAPKVLPAILRTLPFNRAKQIFVALHPECSCSRATIRELVRIMGEAAPAPGTSTDREVRLTLLLYRPKHLPAGWVENNSLQAEADALHPHVVPDMDGLYAAALHASTSGEVLLYSPAGRLLFQGGITEQRGHEGASRGGALLLAALREERTAAQVTNVFGCPIFRAPAPAVTGEAR